MKKWFKTNIGNKKMIMKMNLYCILCLFLTVFSSACGNEKIDGNKTKQVTLTITPSDEIIVEGKGGSVSFTVTPSDPTVALKYVPSVELSLIHI